MTFFEFLKMQLNQGDGYIGMGYFDEVLEFVESCYEDWVVRKTELRKGSRYMVKFLKQYKGCYNRIFEKDAICEFDNYRFGDRKDWENKLVVCYGQGEFDVFTPGEEIEIL